MVGMRARVRALVRSRTALVAGVVVSVAVPLVTLPRLPAVAWWPLVLGLVPWIVGKYVLCPLRWRALTEGDLGRWWHMRAYAESELLGLLTPGHVGADLWRLRRLSRAGLDRGAAVVSVGMDRVVGAIGLAVFVGFAGTALPVHLLLPALGLVVVGGAALLVVRKVRPQWLPERPSLPAPRQLAIGLLL